MLLKTYITHQSGIIDPRDAVYKLVCELYSIRYNCKNWSYAKHLSRSNNDDNNLT